MRLVTFEDPVRQSRIGAMTADGRIVDLHSACALYLRDVESEAAFYRLADALVPPNMRALFRGGDTSLEAAHKAFEYALHHDDGAKAGFSHPILPWIVFFQNVDAIVGHEEPVIYPEHLTQELDYELEL